MFQGGEAVSKTAWVGSIPNRPCHLGVAQLVERAAWDREAVRAGLTTQTNMGL